MDLFNYSSKRKSFEEDVDDIEYRKYHKTEEDWKKMEKKISYLEEKGELIRIAPIKDDYSKEETLAYKFFNHSNFNIIIYKLKDAREIEILGSRTHIKLISNLERKLGLSSKEKGFDLRKEMKKWLKKR